jgi:hypothetical protein
MHNAHGDKGYQGALTLENLTTLDLICSFAKAHYYRLDSYSLGVQ